MTWLQPFIQFFNRPFPHDENSKTFYRNLAYIGLFVAFFLFTFQPFGFQNTRGVMLLAALGYGAVTFFAGALFYLTLGALFQTHVVKQNLTLGKWIVQTMGLILTISVANFMFTSSLAGHVEWPLFPRMLFYTFAIGLFPVTVLGAISMFRQERKYRGIADEIREQQVQKKDLLPEAPGQTIFGVGLSQIRYVEALQNYAKIVYLDDQGQLNEQVERTTLKNILQEVGDYPIVRCHRSFLVNRAIIQTISGNAQGLLLTIADTAQKVPVSRSYVSVFRE